MDEIQELRAAREERIAQLEARVRSPRPMGLRTPVSVVALFGALALLGLMRQDLAYYVSPREPLTLGAAGAYHFERLTSNRYAQVHGIPTARGAYFEEDGQTMVVVGLRDTPLLVRRGALPGEDWTPGSTPPQPSQSAFAIRGRLLTRSDAARYEEGFKLLESWGEVSPRQGTLWMLVEGQRPGADTGLLLVALLLVAVALANAAFLVARLKAWRAR